jgi:hypothetical protein
VICRPAKGELLLNRERFKSVGSDRI